MKYHRPKNLDRLPVTLAFVLPVLMAVAALPFLVGYWRTASDARNGLSGDFAMSSAFSGNAGLSQPSDIGGNPSPFLQSPTGTDLPATGGGSGTTPTAYETSHPPSRPSSSDSSGAYANIIIEPPKESATIRRTSEFFTAAIPALQEALASGSRYDRTILLDPGVRTSAYILARDANYAANLNGYFYFMIDESGSTEMVSPAVLSIAALFDDEEREACMEDGTFAAPDVLGTLRSSLKALLGSYYSEEVFDFLYGNYRERFSRRLRGEPVSSEAVKLVRPGLEVVYRDSFMTYVEFYILG